MKRELKEALAAYIEPINLAANSTRIALGLAPTDVTNRPEIAHQIDYFVAGYKDGAAGYYDKFYEDKIAYKAYLAGNYAGRKLSADFQTIQYS